MYDIVTLEIRDPVVQAAITSVINGNGIIPRPGAYTLMLGGGTSSIENEEGMEVEDKVLVIVGHGTAISLSGCRSWPEYTERLNENIEKAYEQVFVVACSTAEEGNLFLHGNIAAQIKMSYPAATVWASSKPVYPPEFDGDWVKVEGPPAEYGIGGDSSSSFGDEGESSDMDVE